VLRSVQHDSVKWSFEAEWYCCAEPAHLEGGSPDGLCGLWSVSAVQIAAALHLILAAGDAGNGFAIGDVLFDKDPVSERVSVVGFENRNGALQNYRAVIEVLIDEVHGAASDFDSIVEGLLLGIESRKGGQQRRVDVEDAIWKCSNEAGGEQAHVASEADEVDVVFPKAGDKVGVVLGARTAFRNVDGGGKIEIAGGGNSGSVGDVGNDNSNFDVGEAAFSDGFSDGEKVGSAAGEQYAYAKGRFGFRANQWISP
jgi:hypothetical protein